MWPSYRSAELLLGQEIKEALNTHAEQFGKEKSGVKTLKSHVEEERVFELFEEISDQQKYTDECTEILKEWRGDYGTRRPNSLRTLVDQLDRSGANETPELTYELEKAKKDRETLHRCGHEIELPYPLLFRGLFQEHGVSREEFTSTSMSYNGARKYGVPLMIIYVPSKKVRGLVVLTKDDGIGSDEDSEILLLNPTLFECSANVTKHVVDHFIQRKMDQSIQTENLLKVFEYKGYEEK